MARIQVQAGRGGRRVRWLVAALVVAAGCRSVAREMVFRPDTDDRSGLSEAFLSDGGLLLLCGAVTDVDFMRAATARGDAETLVQRSYTLTLRLGDEPGFGSTLEEISIDDHATLEASTGSSACDFADTREGDFPQETGWTRIGMAWVGNDPVSGDAIRAGELPPPKPDARASLYVVDREMGPVYLFSGRATPDGADRRILFRLGTGHIERLWPSLPWKAEQHRELRIRRWGRYVPPDAIARQRTGDGSIAVIDARATPVLADASDRVEVRVGDRIGIQFEAVGIAERATFPVEIQVHYPGPEGVGVGVARWAATAQGGVERYTGFAFRDRCLLLPGTWRFEIHHEGRRLAMKEIEVTIAADQPGRDGCPPP